MWIRLILLLAFLASSAEGAEVRNRRIKGARGSIKKRRLGKKDSDDVNGKKDSSDSSDVPSASPTYNSGGGITGTPAPSGSAGPSSVPTSTPVPPTVPPSTPPPQPTMSPVATGTPAPNGSSGVSSPPSSASVPSTVPSFSPTSTPSSQSSVSPTIRGTPRPSGSVKPSSGPTGVPMPSTAPSISPSSMPSSQPSMPPSGVVVSPPDGSACWKNMNDVTLQDLVAFLTDPTFDSTMPRVYTFCPGSVVNVGYFGPGTSFLPFSLVGDNLPLIPLNPYMHVRCGDSGESSNNCIFRGGQEHILTQADTVFISALLPFLPFLVPGLSSLPSLPADYIPNSSNFKIEGFTFEDSAGYEQDDFDHPIVAFLGAGENMVIKDCIFRNNAINGEATTVAYSAVTMWRVPAAQIGTGAYSSLTIMDTVFEANFFQEGVVTTSFDGTAQENSDPSLVELTIKDCTFSSNVVIGPSSTLAVIKADLHTTLKVEDSCFTNNIIADDGTLANAAIVSSSAGNGSYGNLFGTGNTLPVSSTCPQIAQYMMDGALTSIVGTSCAAFDAATCGAV